MNGVPHQNNVCLSHAISSTVTSARDLARLLGMVKTGKGKIDVNHSKIFTLKGGDPCKTTGCYTVVPRDKKKKKKT